MSSKRAMIEFTGQATGQAAEHDKKIMRQLVAERYYVYI